MHKITSIVSLAILLSAANVKADVIYELVETGTGDVRATLDFDSTVFGASATSSWTAPVGVSLASLLEGGISGFMVDFGSGLEAAIGGDLPDALFQPFFSLDGSELDFGFYWDSVSSVIFASGSIGRVTADNFAGSDTIASLDFSFAVNGDWVLQSDDVPVASPIALDIEFEGAELFDLRNLTIGWEFSITEEITVDALGAWDQNADGLNSAQNVSIWTAAGVLVGSVLVDNTATGVAPGFASNTSGQWLQQDVADFVLGVGDYVIGATRFGISGDAFQSVDTVIQTDPRVAYTGGRFLDAFGFPTIEIAAGPGTASVFGPTFWIAASVAVPDIDVAPTTVNFGDVEVGSVQTAIVTISNVTGADLTVSGTSLQSGADYAITSAPPLPVVIVAGGFVDVTVSFTPLAAGARPTDFLDISSNDPDEGLVSVPLDGTGVAITLPPSEQIGDIVMAIEDGIAGATLTPEGPGASGPGRVRALINMLLAADDLIADGLIDEACQQLLDAYRKMDGLSGRGEPPDFISGPDTALVASLVQDLRADLGCP